MSNEKSPVSIDLGVKASLEVKAEIPKASAGRLVDAITDLIRPFSERRGLCGDLLRLEREKVLYEIAKRARARIELEGKPVRKLPSKLLLPLLEKASLEDPEDLVLIEMWANLLATAATEDVTLLSQYIDILSQISGRQAKILEDVLLKDVEDTTKLTVDHFHDSYDYLNQTGFPGIAKKASECSSAAELGEVLLSGLGVVGVAIDTLQIWNDEDENDEWEINAPDGVFHDDLFFDFAMLERLSLVRKVESKGDKFGKFQIYMHYYVATPIGCDLFACCNPTKLKRKEVMSPRLTDA